MLALIGIVGVLSLFLDLFWEQEGFIKLAIVGLTLFCLVSGGVL